MVEKMKRELKVKYKISTRYTNVLN